ncbi:MAG TPA: tetratricopeptide repeat protein [Caldimonas sp.]
MTRKPLDSPYTIRSIQEMLGLSRGVISSLIAAGFVAPTRGARGEYRFTFQDVVLLRTAAELQAARIAPRRILQALRRLKERLPAELPLAGLRISAVGNDVTVREGGAQWQADSGQLVMDFQFAPVKGSVTFLQRPSALAPAPASVRLPASAEAIDAAFGLGEALESTDRKAAEVAYRKVLALDPDHADAYLNLGALLCEAKRCKEAVALYDEALRRKPGEALLHFNRAVALEDQGRPMEALAAYNVSLQLAPDLADAHYNAARLHEQLGDAKNAVRHFSAYRRLERRR